MCGLLSCGLFDYIIFYIQISGDFTFLLHFKLGVNGGFQPDFHGWLNTGIAHWLRGPGSSNILGNSDSKRIKSIFLHLSLF